MKLTIQCFVVFAALLFTSALPFSSGYVEPDCGNLGCCYHTHGFCAKCCEPGEVGFGGGPGGFGGGQGGDLGYGRGQGGYGDGGYVEPTCMWGCCQSYIGRCVQCCPSPWIHWIPPMKFERAWLPEPKKN